MVVDSSDLDVSVFGGESTDDASSAGSDDGFVWEAENGTTSKRNADTTTDVSSTQTRSDDPFEWSGAVDAEPDERDGNATTADSTVDDATSDMNGDGVSGLSGASPETDDGPTERVVIDPIDYSVEELRTVADCENVDVVSSGEENQVHGFVWADPPEQHRAHVEDPTPEQFERLLALTEIDPERLGEKPYLTRISPHDAGRFIRGWLEFLTAEAGTDGAHDALERYCEIGWITQPVAEELEEELRGFDHRNGNGYETFDRADHLLSFLYLAKIASLSYQGMVFY